MSGDTTGMGRQTTDKESIGVRQLGELEAAVMDRLWAWERPATVREVLDDLNQDRQLAYTTVMTVMDNLHRKGLLSRQADGRAYRYSTTQSRAEHSANLIAAVLADADDRTAPLLRFVDQMSPAEVERLRASLEAGRDDRFVASRTEVRRRGRKR